VYGDPIENREAAMKCLALTLEVFTPRSHRRNWLITLKQRALVRLTGERSVEEEGIDTERAIAELEMVVKYANPDGEFDIWSSACGSLVLLC
jgi:hypothetical protein